MTIRLILAMLCLLAAFIALFVPPLDTGVAGAAPFHVRRVVAPIAGALGVVFVLLACIHIVSPGQVGIPVTFGKTGSPLNQGVAFTNPFAQVKKMSVRTLTYTMSASSTEGVKTGDDSIQANTRDAASVKVDATLVYHLNQASAGAVYRKMGTDYSELLRSTARTAIRGAFGNYDAIPAATTQRAELSRAVEDELVRTLSPRGITVEAFQLRNVALPQQLQNAVASRLNAQQQAEQQKFELQKTIQQAEIRRQDAHGLADAQAIIQQTLTPQYLQYLYVQSLEKIAASPNNSTVILPFDQHLTPLLNMGGSGKAGK